MAKLENLIITTVIAGVIGLGIALKYKRAEPSSLDSALQRLEQIPTNEHTSENHGYKIPLQVGPVAVAMTGNSADEKMQMMQVIEGQSQKGYWTAMVTMPGGAYASMGLAPENDIFFRIYPERNLAQVLIGKSKISRSLDDERALLRGMAILKGYAPVPDSNSDALLGGEPAKKMLLRSGAGYVTYLIADHAQERYTLTFTYNQGFSDPAQTFTKIEQEFEFLR